MRKLFALGLVALALVGGCTSASSSSGPDAGYAIDMEIQPSPMQSGRLATVTIRVRDGDKPLSGASVMFKGQHTGMSMGGGGTVDTQERGPGSYTGGFSPTMGGKYAIKVTVEGPRGRSEKTIDAEAQ